MMGDGDGRYREGRERLQGLRHLLIDIEPVSTIGSSEPAGNIKVEGEPLVWLMPVHIFAKPSQ